MAHQLRLDLPPPSELPERERLNRIRAGFFITLVDTLHCVQRGKTPAKPRSDYPSQIFDSWYRSSVFNLPYDIYCAAYLDITCLASRLLDCIRADKSNPDLWQVCTRV